MSEAWRKRKDVPVEQLEALGRAGFGWLSPDGALIPCGLHDHLQAIAAVPSVAAMVQPLLARKAEVDEIEAGCQEISDREGASNAEWHVYECAFEDWRVEIRTVFDRLHADGWIRLGTGTNYEGKVLEAEGFFDTPQTSKPALTAVAETIGATLRATPISDWREEEARKDAGPSPN